MTLTTALLLAAAEITLPVATVAEKSDLRVNTYPGRVVPVAKVDVVPQVSGEILEVAFQNGAVVKEGDVLYRIDPVKYEAAVKNAESKLQECKANVKYSELSYERHRKLLETRAVSLDAVDNALSQRDSSRAAFAAAQAELVSAKDDLNHCTITAPVAGKLGSTAKTRGNYARKGDETLVTLVQNAPIRVRFSVSNREFLDMFGGMSRRIKEEARISLALANGEAYSEPGEVEYVDNAADEYTDTICVFALFPNAERKLKPGGTVRVSLTSQNGVPRPAIPSTAVLQDVRGPYVWVLGPGDVAERRYIARGGTCEDGSMLFVEKGLRIGERVVADGGHKVRPGMVVKRAP